MLKQFIRNFSKQKTVGLLNICSLSLGIMVSVIIGLWTINETNFDKFHKDGDRIYRATISLDFTEKREHLTGTFKPFGEAVTREYPEIEEMCRIVIQSSEEIWINGEINTNNKALVADSTFFKLFTYPLIEGDINTVLNSSEKVVISQSAAKKYFKDQNPIGKTIQYNGVDFHISGIMKDLPHNTHLGGDFIFPMFGYLQECDWGWSDIFCTYFRLNKNADINKLETGMSQILHKNMDFFRINNAAISLVPIQDIHLGESNRFDNSITESKSTVYIFAITAIIILSLSCINFANLFISTSFIRARSIGIKKSQGASKFALIKDFYLETAGYVLIAIAIAIFLTIYTIPIFNQFTRSGLYIDYSTLQPYAFIALLFVFTTLLAGSFPALYMTKFNIIETLSGKFRGKRVSAFQKVLIIIQFTAAIILLTVVTFMYRQIDFIINQDKGFNTESIMYVHSREKFGLEPNYESFCEEMKTEPSIVAITKKNSLPTQWVQGWGLALPGKDESLTMEICRVQANYFDVLGMTIIDGENPFYLSTADSGKVCVINESAVKMFGLTDPVGKEIVPYGNPKDVLIIAGVVKDAQTVSFHRQTDPQVYLKLTKDWESYKPIFFKIKGDPQRAIEHIKRKWEAEVPKIPFEYNFLDDDYKALYKSDLNTSQVFLFAMGITILITVAGLFAMAYYSTQRRIREIGLRKINGATVSNLLVLLNKEFITWVLISFVIACPISYFSLKSWLTSFIRQAPLSWWIFALIGLLAVLIAIATVSYQTWKVATMNPIKALKED